MNRCLMGDCPKGEPHCPGCDEDAEREVRAVEFDAFHRGIQASIRALQRETPLAKGSITVLRDLLAAAGGNNR
jgi:hypothetical protein